MRIIFYCIILILYAGCTASNQSQQKKVFLPKKQEAPLVIKQPQVQIIEEQETIENEVIEEAVMQSAYKLAIVFPSQIMSKYGVDVTKVINVYMLQQNIDMNIEVFDCIDQSYENMINTFNQLDEQDYKNVLALFTPNMVEQLKMIPQIDQFRIYVPTIHKKEVSNSLSNVIFGGIDYEEQIKTLVNLSKGQIVNFYSHRGISQKLTKILEQNYPNVRSIAISDETNYTDLFKNGNFEHKSIFLNTTLIKSSILLSQIRANEIEPYVILTTQLNYNPHIISMTQFEDRQQLRYANSIGNIDELLLENSSLLGADIAYDWVNYSAIIGADYLLRQDMYADSVLEYKIEDNQVIYDVTLIKNDDFGFKQYLQATKN